jgi:hypothetical protein
MSFRNFKALQIPQRVKKGAPRTSPKRARKLWNTSAKGLSHNFTFAKTGLNHCAFDQRLQLGFETDL